MKGFVNKQRGAATVELIVGSLAALPLFFGISMLGKYADMRHKTVESARYIVWESVIWPNGTKVSAVLEQEATDRFMGHRKSPIKDIQTIATGGVTEDPLWRDYKARTLMVADGSTVRVNVSTNNIAPVQHNGAVRTVAYSGLGGRDLGLPSHMISTFRVELPITDRTRNPKDTKPSTLAGFFDPNSYELASVLNLNATGGIITDSWVSNNASEYHSRVEDLSVESLVRPVVVVGTRTFGAFFPFREGRYGQNTDFVAAPEVVLSEYVAP